MCVKRHAAGSVWCGAGLFRRCRACVQAVREVRRLDAEPKGRCYRACAAGAGNAGGVYVVNVNCGVGGADIPRAVKSEIAFIIYRKEVSREKYIIYQYVTTSISRFHMTRASVARAPTLPQSPHWAIQLAAN